MRKTIIKESKNTKARIKNRHDLFDHLQTGWENPDYSCIEIYWQVLKPKGSNKPEFTISATEISKALAPQNENKSYYSYPTIRRKLKKLEGCGLIAINKVERISGAEYVVPKYVFLIKIL